MFITVYKYDCIMLSFAYKQLVTFSLLYCRCYDVGDSVKINDVSLTVKSIHLFNTTFIGSSGENYYIANSELVSKNIQNMYRSKNAIVSADVIVSNTTTADQISSLKNVIGLYLKKTKKWSTEFDMKVTSMSLPDNSITLSISLKHQSSWRRGKR